MKSTKLVRLNCLLKKIGIPMVMGMVFQIQIFAQISPGDLAQAHAQLEGITNCTKCHSLGEKLTNTKCLDCHTEIKNLIISKEGYHASKEVEGKFCYTCHSDHHGRKFQLTRFDQDKFDHHLAGYDLKGKHSTVSCNACHKSDFIRDPKLKIKKSTWLGLSKDCRNCHEDYHQNTLSANCSACHSLNSFKPAPGFDHRKTAFQLKGKHAFVDCVKCHPVIKKEGKEFTQYAGIVFDNCTNCHKDPHKNTFGQQCKSCHSEDSFLKITSSKTFDHSRTGYPLTGKHQTVNCLLCHKGNYSKPLPHDKCTDCHSDYHKNQFAKNGTNPDCNDCHYTEEFSKTSFTVERHKETIFPLTDSHQSISCAACHKKTSNWQFKGINKSCADCHANYHGNEFKTRGCQECHSSKSFREVLFSIDQHNKIYPLEGAHMATPCISCHQRNTDKKWAFNIGTQCIDCHSNIHKGIIKEKYFPNHDCRNCHHTNSWKEITFDHSLTTYSLQGRHKEISCASCHLLKRVNGQFEQNFNIKSNECESCHHDIHARQFEKNGTTPCYECHGQTSWKAALFNHDSTGFVLGKSHEKLSCNLCHEKAKNGNGVFTNYKTNKTKCADCHS